MIALLKRLLLAMARLIGAEVTDERTGGKLGRALCLAGPWGIWMIGLPHAVRMMFIPEKTTLYTRHRIGFATHEEPDYASLHEGGDVRSDSLLWAIIVHQQPEQIEALLGYWESLGYSRDRMLIVHAGKKADFEAMDIPNKVFVEDAEIRTTHHPLERQSYHGVFREVTAWMSGKDFGAVVLVEYDHLPLVPDWGEKLCGLMERERADVLCHHLTRVDDTNASHYLYHLQDRRFRNLWKNLSLREEKAVFFNAIMTGSVWRRDAFEAVAAHQEPFPVYLELYLPSLAHHLGYRVRGHGDQDPFIQVVPREDPFSDRWVQEGAWSLHQVKSLVGFSGKSR
ncbi:MAG: hypothetical protein K8R57_05130 [Verrucomicrobia bacterium]|nr:hypothetical protein [Verrucomicrobiota bacterium]